MINKQEADDARAEMEVAKATLDRARKELEQCPAGSDARADLLARLCDADREYRIAQGVYVGYEIGRKVG